jgi:hypothetical protein
MPVSKDKNVHPDIKKYLGEIKDEINNEFNNIDFNILFEDTKKNIDNKFRHYDKIIKFINENLENILNDDLIITELTNNFKKNICFESLPDSDKKKGIKMCKKNINTNILDKIRSNNVNKNIEKNLYDIFEVEKILKNSKIDSNVYVIGEEIKDNKVINTFENQIEIINTKLLKTQNEIEEDFITNLIQLCTLISDVNNITNDTYLTGFGLHIICIYIYTYINTKELYFTNKLDIFKNIFGFASVSELNSYSIIISDHHKVSSAYSTTILNLAKNSASDLALRTAL